MASMPGRNAHLPEPLTYQKFGAIMDDAGVGHAVLVPPSWEGDHVDYSLEAAQKYPNRFAVMGRFPVNKPEERGKLETWRNQKGMLGVRLTLHHEWDRVWMRDGTADWFWPAAERLGIPVMLNTPYTHKEIGEVAARHPRLRIILDHSARARRRRMIYSGPRSKARQFGGASQCPRQADPGAGVLDCAVPYKIFSPKSAA